VLRFIAVHPTAFSEEMLQPLARESLPEGVVWKATFSAFDDDKTYCHWEAASKDDVLAVFTKYQIPYEVIHEVRLFDPVTGMMEAAPIGGEVLQPV
jgi:hypothetical protein